jgi:lipid-binding SYLF domain-containing protein
VGKIRQWLVALSLALACTLGLPASSARADSGAELDAKSRSALERLYSQSERARRYAKDAHAILVFPKIVKAGLIMVGGQSGEGTLFLKGKPAGHYRITAGSFGIQAGGQSFSYALFLMNDAALTYLRKSDGWAIGSGPSVVVVDKGKAMSTTSTTIAKDVYAFPFGQKGLMAGLGLEGSKISPINK